MSDAPDPLSGRPPGPWPEAEPLGPARDFSSFCELELERRRNSDDDFDPDLFAAAVTLVLAKLQGNAA